jgi:hypothetical protein
MARPPDPERCNCGPLHFADVDPAAYRDVAALVSAAYHGDAKAFEALYAARHPDLAKPLVEAVCEVISASEPASEGHHESLERFCRAVAKMADDAEKRLGHRRRLESRLQLWKAEPVPLSIPVLPDSYHDAGELVSAYVGADEERFYRIAENVRPGVVIALLEGTRVLLELFADDHGWSLQRAAEVYCKGAAAAAKAPQ